MPIGNTAGKKQVRVANKPLTTENIPDNLYSILLVQM